MGSLPRIGDQVHYVAYGTPKGEFPSVCRVGIVTEKPTDYWDGHEEMLEQGLLGLAVVNPTGLFFRSIAEGGVKEHQRPTEHVTESTLGQKNDGSDRLAYPYPGGTWHWACGA